MAHSLAVAGVMLTSQVAARALLAGVGLIGEGLNRKAAHASTLVIALGALSKDDAGRPLVQETRR